MSTPLKSSRVPSTRLTTPSGGTSVWMVLVYFVAIPALAIAIAAIVYAVGAANLNSTQDTRINLLNATLLNQTDEGIISVNTQHPNTARDLQLVGQGMITVHPGSIPSEVAVDGTTLSTAVNNLDMTVSMQSMKIAQLNATDANLQAQINAINVSSSIVQLMMTDSTFNVTIMQLIMNVTLLQAQVAALTTQVNTGLVPIGTLVPWSGTAMTVPSGYLFCNGANVSQSTYAALFAVVGCQYCPGMTCSMSNFCLPDLQGRVPVGVGGAGFLTRGVKVGAETHTLSTTEMPTHSHSGNTNTDGTHSHSLELRNGCECESGTNCNSFSGVGAAQALATSGIYVPQYSGFTASGNDFCTSGIVPPATYPFTKYVGGASNGAIPSGSAHSHAFSTSSAGSGAAHNIVQPSTVVGAYMIKH